MILFFRISLICLFLLYSGCVVGPGVEPPRLQDEDERGSSFDAEMDAGPGLTTGSSGQGGSTATPVLDGMDSSTESHLEDSDLGSDDAGTDPSDDSGQ